MDWGLGGPSEEEGFGQSPEQENMPAEEGEFQATLRASARPRGRDSRQRAQPRGRESKWRQTGLVLGEDGRASSGTAWRPQSAVPFRFWAHRQVGDGLSGWTCHGPVSMWT